MKKLRGNASLIIALVAVAIIWIVACLSGDCFFDLNDDVLMKDILSGAYTGVPEGHNIQMLYPISLLISLLYRIGANIDWYGIFLCSCQYFCIGIVIYEIVKRTGTISKKILTAIALVPVVLGFFLPHLLYVQYTVVCGLLSATAAFLIVLPAIGKDKDAIQGKEKKPKRGAMNTDNMVRLICAFVMLTVAYLLRSEMMLLTLPMVLVAVLIKWLFSSLERDKKEDKKSVLLSYSGFLGCVLIMLLISTLLHNIAYSSPEWKEFNRFFDNRTELYDFQYIPDYEENKAFFNGIGLAKSEWKLLVNYNFGLSDEIDADMLGEIAEYAAGIRGEQAPFFARLKTAASLYFYRMHHLSLPKSYEYPMTDFPWNMAVAAMYVTVLLLAVLYCRRHRNGGEKMALASCFLPVVLFACRTSLWLFIIMRGRDPIRITHPLYMVELLILAGMMLYLTSKEASIIPAASIIVLTAISAITLPAQIRVISSEKNLREEMLVKYRALDDYARKNADSFYFYDVYTGVSFASEVEGQVATYSEKLFEKVDNSCYNRDLLGGWASKSPLAMKKLKNAGFNSTFEALLDSNVYFVQNKTEDVTWLSDFYEDQGVSVDISRVDTVADVFGIYAVTRLE